MATAESPENDRPVRIDPLSGDIHNSRCHFHVTVGAKLYHKFTTPGLGLRMIVRSRRYFGNAACLSCSGKQRCSTIASGSVGCVDMVDQNVRVV